MLLKSLKYWTFSRREGIEKWQTNIKVLVEEKNLSLELD